MAEDRYKYFRIEARELVEGLGRGVLEIERGVPAHDRADALLRLAHTLKGAARVVKLTAVAEAAHAIEEVLLPFRQSEGVMPRDRIEALLATIDRIQTELRAIEPQPAPTGAPAARAVEALESFDTVRVDVLEMDRLLEGISETGARLTALRRTVTELQDARRKAAQLVAQLSPGPNGAVHPAREAADGLEVFLGQVERRLDSGLDQAERETTEVQERASELRLLPASVIFPALERVVRDAAHAVGREVRLDTAGGENRLDAHVLGAVRTALFHVARNAVTHGIEPAAERTKAGKPAAGRVSLHVRRRGHRLVFTVEDDGRGIDADSVRRTAIDRGLISSQEAAGLSSEETIRLIFRGGMSTAAETTEVAGRGIGLDVLRATVSQLKGDVTVSTEPSRGTTIEVSVPVSLSAMPALFFESGGMVASIPLDAVEKSLQITTTDVTRSAEGASVVHEGTSIRFLSLARAPIEKRAQTAIIVRAGGDRAAIGVDRLLGTGRVVVKRLPRLVQSLSLAVGAALDAEGLPQLVLDPAGLVAAAGSARDERLAEAPLRQMPILVVDDSLTTRMMEQSILESAGYQVDLATSAEEALVKAHERPYALFVVDVEMPGMDGFEFLERTRRDSVLRDTPGILVTSRGSPDDLRRGQDAGARGHIVKSAFDQKHFLDTVQRLIG